MRVERTGDTTRNWYSLDFERPAVKAFVAVATYALLVIGSGACFFSSMGPQDRSVTHEVCKGVFFALLFITAVALLTLRALCWIHGGRSVQREAVRLEAQV